MTPPLFGTPRGYNLNGILKKIAPMMDFNAPGAISVNSGFLQESLEPGPSGPELSALPTGQ